MASKKKTPQISLKFGDLIQVYWPLDDAWYNGEIIAKLGKEGSFRIMYDDGEFENLDLRKEQFRMQGQDTSEKTKVEVEENKEECSKEECSNETDGKEECSKGSNQETKKRAGGSSKESKASRPKRQKDSKASEKESRAADVDEVPPTIKPTRASGRTTFSKQSIDPSAEEEVEVEEFVNLPTPKGKRLSARGWFGGWGMSSEDKTDDKAQEPDWVNEWAAPVSVDVDVDEHGSDSD